MFWVLKVTVCFHSTMNPFISRDQGKFDSSYDPFKQNFFSDGHTLWCVIACCCTRLRLSPSKQLMGRQWGTEARRDMHHQSYPASDLIIFTIVLSTLVSCTHYPRRPTLDSLLAIIYVINTWPRQRRAEWLRIRGGRRGKCIFSSKILSLPYLKVSPQSCMKDGQQCGHTAISYLPYEKLRLSTGGVRCLVIYDARALYLYGPSFNLILKYRPLYRGYK